MTKAKIRPYVPSRVSRDPRAGAADADTLERVRLAVGAAEDRKALDLKVLQLGEVSDFTDYFVICSGTSERQVQAIAEAVDESLRSHGARPLHLEGLREGQWILLDYGDLVVHIFEEDRRDFYRLERLWSDAPDVTDDFVA
jgi:ribosome-associated protein